jgi:chemotaxis response regulator CheB
VKEGRKIPNIVVIGASAGGVEPLREIVRSLPAKLPAPWKATTATDGERIEPTGIYVAQPDLHMLVEPGRIRLTPGVCFCRNTILMRLFLNNNHNEPLFGGLS